MSRSHNGGFISVENYWNIGTPDRGQDGDTARLASKKYNDHRHSAILINDGQSMISWIEEKQLASIHPSNPSNQGGIIEDNLNESIRRPGDLAIYDGILWMSNGNNVVALGSPGIFLNANGQIVKRSFVTEYPFTTYGEFSAPSAPDLANRPKQYVGSVVVNYDDYALNPDGTTSEIELVAGIRSIVLDEYIIQLGETYPEIAILLTEGEGLSIKATFRVERYALIPDPQIPGEGRFLINIDENIEIPLTAYADNGHRLLKQSLPLAGNNTYMYNLYIIKPTADELLADLLATPELAADLDQVGMQEILTNILNDASIDISKASVKIRNRA